MKTSMGNTHVSPSFQGANTVLRESLHGSVSPGLHLSDVVVSFDGKHRVLDGISLVVQHSESWAIVGESGEGKTTLLNVMSGFLKAQSGSVVWQGEDKDGPHGSASWRQEVLSVVRQHHQLLDEFTALENVAMAWSRSSQSWEEALSLAREEMVRLELSHRLHAYPGSLSGGERQRVGLARALVKRPRLLLADEPTGSLSTRMSREVVKLLLEAVQSSSTALVVVTHTEDVADQMQKGLRISDGKLQPR